MVSFNFFTKRIFAGQLVDFFKNLSLMSKSGIPLNEALQIIASQTQGRTFKQFLITVRKQVEQGSSFSNALKPYQDALGDLVLNVIRAGEINGTLEDNFQYLAEILNRRRELKQKIQSALLYPEIVLVLAFFIGGGIAIFVLPKLIPLFKSLNVELPISTRILLAISVFLQHNGFLAFGGVIIGFVVLSFLGRISGFRWVYHTIALRIPFFGRLTKNYQLALFSQLFGTLFKSGLTIKETLAVTTDAMTNVRYQGVLRKAAKRLVTGVPLATILGKYPTFFPTNVTAVVTVGENSGTLDESFTYLAAYYDNEVDVQTKRLPTLIEPLMLMAIGIIVAFIAIAIISPIYEITSGIKARR